MALRKDGPVNLLRNLSGRRFPHNVSSGLFGDCKETGARRPEDDECDQKALGFLWSVHSPRICGLLPGWGMGNERL